MEKTAIKGGARAWAGRPKKQSEKKQSYNVSLSASQKKALVNKYGTLTRALEHMLRISDFGS